MIQASLDFSPPPQAHSLPDAARAGDRAIAIGAAKAASIDPAFLQRAADHMLAYLRAHGVSSGEILTDSCKLAGIRSSDDRHFGAVTRRLLSRGLIRWAGPCKRTKGHATRGGSLYELAVGE